MEEVVRLASDPAIEYRGKHSTVSKLAQLLQDMRGAACRPTGVNAQPLASPAVPFAAEAQMQSGTEAQMQSVRGVLGRLESARVVAVLRGGHPQRIYERGMELGAMPGCRAIEVALDTHGALQALGALARDLPASVAVGAATAMSAGEATEAVRHGAMFVTSPVNPRGFVEACHAGGALAIPGGMTPSELLAALSEGALAAKIFPAGAYTPAALRQVLAVGPFRGARVMVSGGVAPGDHLAWFEAGATFVGMGGGLVGADVALSSSPGEKGGGGGWWDEVAARDLFSSLGEAGTGR